MLTGSCPRTLLLPKHPWSLSTVLCACSVWGCDCLWLQSTECITLLMYIVVSDVLSVPQRAAAGSVGCVHEINERGLQPKEYFPTGNPPGEECPPGGRQHCVDMAASSQGVWTASTAQLLLADLFSFKSFHWIAVVCMDELRDYQQDLCYSWSRDTQAAIGGKNRLPRVKLWLCGICIRFLL